MRVANVIRTGAAASLVWFVFLGAAGVAAVGVARAARARDLMMLAVAGVLFGACVAAIQASISVVDRAAVPGASDRKAVAVAALRAGWVPSVVLIAGDLVLFQWQQGEAFTWSAVWPQLAIGVLGIFAAVMVFASIRARQLDQFRSAPLRGAERRTLAGFARHRGRAGALTLTNERLLFRALDSDDTIDVPLARIRTTSRVSTLGFPRGVDVDATNAIWRFTMPDPDRWIDALGAPPRREVSR